ncbi:MAG: ORF6N domain-containing protein [Muribaculaceae bacterium]|nr:ORF6N domain-containing protein [Muribaculaceae bacterium]
MADTNQIALKRANNNTQEVSIESTQLDIKNLIYVVRNQQVMLDSDIAMLYQVETKSLNRAVKRNIKRFPKDFCFQLTMEEFEILRCQIGTSKIGASGTSDNRGGRRYLPYVFTEQGIAAVGISETEE